MENFMMKKKIFFIKTVLSFIGPTAKVTEDSIKRDS